MSGFEIVGLVLGSTSLVRDALIHLHNSSYFIITAQISDEIKDVVEYIRLAEPINKARVAEVENQFLKINASLEAAEVISSEKFTRVAILAGLVVGTPILPRRLERLLEKLSSQVEELYSVINQWQSNNRITFINEIRESPQFKVLEIYDSAVLEALLSQYETSAAGEEETAYFLPLTKLVNRVLGLGPASNQGIGREKETEDALRQEADRRLLESMSYTAMERRQGGIGPAFAPSLQWVFDEPRNKKKGTQKRTNIANWLRQETQSGLYLIEGSEGSGKSTLMKYIYRHRETAACLDQWAAWDSCPLVRAEFYFWRSGTRLERSEEGLLRSLLHSVLRQQPQLMPIVFPKEWAALYAAASDDARSSLRPGLGPWTVPILRDAFLRLLRQDQVRVKFFFLIDGVDEHLESDGESASAILDLLITGTAASSNTKAIISSRPLSAADSARIMPRFKLNDLNHNDIQSCVQKLLDADVNFQREKGKEPTAADAIIKKILEFSGGTFLIGVLCVSTLRAYLAEGKSLSEISQDMFSQSPHLQELYERLWSNMHATTRRWASQSALVLISQGDIERYPSDAWGGDIRLVDLALALGELRDTIDSAIKPWPRCMFKVQTKCDALAREFTMVWPGFITTTKPQQDGTPWDPSSVIRYCHRSVPEFFRRTYNTLLENAAEAPFRPGVALLKSAVQQLKFVPLNTAPQQLWAFATMALLAANHADQELTCRDERPGFEYLALLTELDKTMQHHHVNLQRDDNGHFRGTTIQDPNTIDRKQRKT
ncbi:hypothetical protein B0T16DRAFT_390023 [Cercophora newfieldiana]|uniref:NACHT domain-containing protein n=1 Tax=Cercophora newfieldiana TaxID=92897 RepID=A0AA40CQC8_9PEZI|nr:hypothetical protein B0T16DRAFT_390023 [Cercophora newfieldiana]